MIHKVTTPVLEKRGIGVDARGLAFPSVNYFFNRFSRKNRNLGGYLMLAHRLDNFNFIVTTQVY